MDIGRWLLGITGLLAVGAVAYRAEVSALAGAKKTWAAPSQSARSQGSGPANWEAQSFTDDPANLKGERVPASEAEPLAVDRGAPGLEQMLRKLTTRASLMLIVAHPDDEDGGMLAYESRGQGARVGMLTLTRGEGGQNVMTGDFNDALGLVRTRELLAADRYMGVDQLFGTEVDFGFSKTKEECLAQWTHERVLYDAVRAVRLYRPLIVASVFIGAPSDGHGQHQVSGEIAQEVFTAAADPKLFPEMGLPPWAPAKVYARVPFARIDDQGMFDYATGKYVPARFYNYVSKTWSTEPPTATVTIPEGEYSAALGKSYVQFAREGLALQRTQIGSGMRLPPAGRFDVGYTRYGSRTQTGSTERSFFEGVDVSLPGIASLAPLQQAALRPDLERISGLVAQAQATFSAAQPETIAPVLRDGLLATRALIAKVETLKGMPERERYDVLHELRVKEAQFNQALVGALGISLRAEVIENGPTPDRIPPLAKQSSEAVPTSAVPGQQLTAQVETANAGREPLQVEDKTAPVAVGMAFDRGTGRTDAGDQLPAGGTHERLLYPRVRDDAGCTRPYFTRPSLEQPFYDLRDPRLRNAPATPAALTAWETVWYGNVPLTVGAVVQLRSAGNDAAAITQPLEIEPAVSVAIASRAGVIPAGEKRFPVPVDVRFAQGGEAHGTLRLDLPNGWTATPSASSFKRGSGADANATVFSVTPSSLREQRYRLTAVADYGGKQYREGFTRVGYPGLLRDNLFAPATYEARPVEVTVPTGLRIAFLPGTGDAVATSLEDIGIHAATVSVAEIAAGKLKGFDVLLMGVRAYAAHQDLPGVTGKLTEFATAGGVVVLQYQTPEFDGRDAPFPLSLGGAAEKVVEENAPVHLLAPGAQVLSWPNRITSKDFDGWVEERGHGFMHDWNPHFEAVTEVHDAGQDPQKGGLLVARVGQGAYVYCAYALYRQLPEGVPGAFRLMANIVSLGRKP